MSSLRDKMWICDLDLEPVEWTRQWLADLT